VICGMRASIAASIHYLWDGRCQTGLVKSLRSKAGIIGNASRM
jgi:hypothetical protein